MQQWTEIRRKVLVEGASKRSVIKDYQIGARTLEKVLSHSQPPGYRLDSPRNKTKLGPFLGVIDQILADDIGAPKKQRHTSKRIVERLQSEYGYSGGRTQVYQYVAQQKRHSKEVFVPLSQNPGEAQYDFGYGQVIIGGIEVQAAISVMTLPYSDVFHVSAYARECTETFYAGQTHVTTWHFWKKARSFRLRTATGGLGAA